MDALSDMLANEIRELGNYRVIGKSDIGSVLKLEERKRLAGCTDDSCIAEIGGALGVRWVVVGNISKFGDRYLLNLKVLDAEEVRVVKGVSRKVEGGEGELLDALSDAARQLINESAAQINPRAADTSGTETGTESGTGEPADVTPVLPPPPVIEEKASSTLNTWGHVALWSGAGMTLLGGIAMVLGLHYGDVYNDGYESDETRLDALDKSRTWTAVMWVGYGSGLALMATGIGLWLWDAHADSSDTTASMSPTPDGRGMVFSLGGRW